MMRHLHLLYFFITLAIGSVSLSIAAFIYAKTKYKLARNYLFFYSIFTGLVVSEALRLYLQMNIPQIQVNTLLFFLAPLGFVMMFVASWFMHETFAVPHARLRNMIVGGITLFMVLQHIILGFLEMSASRQDSHIPLDWWIYVVYIFSASGVVYIFGLALIYDTKSEEPFRKKFMKKGSILYVLALPAVFVDMFLREFFPLRLFPLFYCVTSISFTHQFLKYYSVRHAPDSDELYLLSDEDSREEFFGEALVMLNFPVGSALDMTLGYNYNGRGLSGQKQDVLFADLERTTNRNVLQAASGLGSSARSYVRHLGVINLSYPTITEYMGAGTLVFLNILDGSGKIHAYYFFNMTEYLTINAMGTLIFGNSSTLFGSEFHKTTLTFGIDIVF